MVDIRTGRLAFDVTAEAKGGRLQPAFSVVRIGESLADGVRKELGR